MRVPLTPTPSFTHELRFPPDASDPPLVFLDREPFLVELQGALELPGASHGASDTTSNGDGIGEMRGVKVGKIDFEQPVSPWRRRNGIASRLHASRRVGEYQRLAVSCYFATTLTVDIPLMALHCQKSKPILRIAHHRLEGRLVTLTDPYAVLRTTRAAPPSAPDFDTEHAAKRARLTTGHEGSSSPPPPPQSSSPVKPKTTDTSALPLLPPTIEIVGIVRRKIVFSKRPEPMIELSSEG